MKLNFLILTLAVFFGSCVYADFDPNQYRRYVTETYYLNSSNSTFLKLTDGTQYYLEKSYDVNIPIGTEIFISTFYGKTHKEKYYFEFASKESPHQRKYGWLTSRSEDSLPTVKEIHRICIEKGSWFSSAKFIRVLELTDGSRWKVSEYGYNWSTNDHVLISYDRDYRKLTIINTDKLKTFITEEADKTGRISKWQYTYQHSENAEPYLE